MASAIRTAFALAALVFAGYCLPAAAAQPFRIVVPEPQTPLAPNSVIDLADRLGYYKRAGADVEIVRVRATPAALAALASGQGDMANISFDAALQLAARGQLKLRGVISPDTALPYVIAAKSDIRAPKQLEGRTFGVGEIGSADYLQTRRVLERLGVDPNLVRYVALGQPTTRAQALAAGRIDATAITLGTWLTLPSKDGLAVLVDREAYRAAAPFITKLNVVTADTIRDKSDEVAAVVRAIMLASRDFARDPRLWVDAMVAARPDVTRAQLEELAKAYRGSWSVDGGLDVAELATTTTVLYKSEEFQGVPSIAPSQWIDRSFIDDAIRSFGPFRASSPNTH